MQSKDSETIANLLRRTASGLNDVVKAMEDAAYWLQRAARSEAEARLSQDAEPGSSPRAQDTGLGKDYSDGTGPAKRIAESEECVATSDAGTEGLPPAIYPNEPASASDTKKKGRPRKPEAIPPRVPPDGRVLVTDNWAGIVHGPTGSIPAPFELLRVLEKLSNGDLYDVRTLADAGLLEVDALRELLNAWAEKLEDVGIELMKVGREMYRARRVEAPDV